MELLCHGKFKYHNQNALPVNITLNNRHKTTKMYLLS